MGTAYIGAPSYELAGYIAFGVRGNTKLSGTGTGYDGYYVSSNGCGSGCDSKYIGFGSAPYSTEVGSACQVTVEYNVNSQGETVSKHDNGWELTNICEGTSTITPLLGTGFYNGGVSKLLSYAGAPISIYIRPHGGKNWYCFYVKPAGLINGALDKENLGTLFYCGLGTVANAGGIPIYTVNSVSGNSVDFSGHNIDSDLEPISWNRSELCPGFNISPAGDTEVYISTDGSTPDWGDGGDDTGNDDCLDSYKFCGVNIDDCCNDDIFTSDLNEFSSLKSPETYINQDNGEEERISWNGNIHIARALEIGFKVFFALIYKAITIYYCFKKEENDRLKALKDEIEDLKNVIKEKWCGFEVVVESKHSAYGGRASLNYRNDDDLDFLDLEG